MRTRHKPPATSFTCRTSDGVRLRLSATEPEAGAPVLLLCHGFTGSGTNDAMRRLRRELGSDFGVAALDFRGHGASTGASTLGDREALDVEAAATVLRERFPGSPLVGVGFSMGGAAVVRSAALHGGLDAVVALSAPARWRLPRRPAAVLAALLTRTRLGRRLLRHHGVHVHPRWGDPEAPADLAGGISVPTALVYGSSDNYFSLRDGFEIYGALHGPKSLLAIDGGGHGEKLSTVENARLLGRLVRDLLLHGVARTDRFLVARSY